MESGSESAFERNWTRRQVIAGLSLAPVLGRTVVRASAQPAAPGEAVPDLQLLGRLKGHEHTINGLAISPDGKWVASASFDKTIRIWDLETRREMSILKGHEAGVRHVAFTPDGKRVLSGSWDATARLWDAGNGELIRVLRGHEWPVLDVAISPDGRRALTCSDGFRLWDLESGEMLRHFRGHQKTVWCVSFSPDGGRVLTGGWDETVRLWDLDTGLELQKCGGHKDRVMSAVFLPDGNRAFSACTGDNTVRLWNLETGTELRRFNTKEPGITCLAVSPDGRRLLAGEGQTDEQGGLNYQYPAAAAYVWDIESGRPLAKSPPTEGFISSLAVTPDGKTLVSSGYEMSARIWSLPE